MGLLIIEAREQAVDPFESTVWLDVISGSRSPRLRTLS